MSFWRELRRRNVFKVGAAYAVAAWLIIQIVSAIDAPLNLPDWFDTTVIVLVAAGFPVALLLAWAYEVTPDGIKATRHVPAGESITPVTGQRLNYVVTGLLALAVGFMAVDNYLLDNSSPATNGETAGGAAAAAGGSAAAAGGGSDAGSANERPAASVGATASAAAASTGIAIRDKVAVLPCDNLSPNANDAYFAAGIHEEILNQLAKIQSLLIVARTSVLQYAERKPTIPEIARELGATAIMECSVRYAGDDILVTAQLIDPATDAHVWSETYPGNLSDLSAIFAMQADIAMNIANALEAEFSPAEQARLGRVVTESSEAYALFLAALATPAGEDRLALLDQAVVIDPQFASAYALIAASLAETTINTISASATSTWSQVEARAIENAQRALALNPDLEYAYLAKAMLDELSWRWAEAHAGYARAYELNPSEPTIIWRYSWLESFAGNAQPAVRLGRQLVELRPAEADAYTSLSSIYGHTGDIDSAIAACERAIELNPTNVFCQHALGLLNARLGNVARAETQLRLVERFLGANRFLAFLPQLAVAYSQIGRDEDAARIVAEVEAAATSADIGAGGWAVLYLAAGDRQRALEWLQAGVDKAEREEPDPGYYDLMSVRNNVFGHAMLDEPEFVALRRRLGAL